MIVILILGKIMKRISAIALHDTCRISCCVNEKATAEAETPRKTPRRKCQF